MATFNEMNLSRPIASTSSNLKVVPYGYEDEESVQVPRVEESHSMTTTKPQARSRKYLDVIEDDINSELEQDLRADFQELFKKYFQKFKMNYHRRTRNWIKERREKKKLMNKTKQEKKAQPSTSQVSRQVEQPAKKHRLGKSNKTHRVQKEVPPSSRCEQKTRLGQRCARKKQPGQNICGLHAYHSRSNPQRGVAAVV